MSCGAGSSSSSGNRSIASALMSNLSYCAEKAGEAQLQAQHAHASLYNWAVENGKMTAAYPFLRHNLEVQIIISDIMDSLAKSNAIIADIMASAVNNGVAVPLDQFPPGFRPQTQATTSVPPQQNQTSWFPSTNNNVGIPFFPTSFGSNQPTHSQPSLPPLTIQPVKRAALISIPPPPPPYVPQNNQLAAPVAPAQSSSAIIGGKRSLDALYAPNNEAPSRLRHAEPEPHLMEKIVPEYKDRDLTVEWDDIAGLEHVKKCVEDSVVLPALNPTLLKGISSLCKGILLFGPPGTGKTMIGKAIARKLKASLFNISPSSVLSKWGGDSARIVKALFAVAKQSQPSVIFVDEIDSILIRRSTFVDDEFAYRLKKQLFTEMEGVNSSNDQIIVIGATTRPQDLDEAVRRLFNKRVYVPLPNAEARLTIIDKAMKKAGKELLRSKEDTDALSNMTKGYSGMELDKMAKEAMMGPVREMFKAANTEKNIKEMKPEELRPVCLKDFEKAFRLVRPSVSHSEVAAYAEWDARYGSI